MNFRFIIALFFGFLVLSTTASIAQQGDFVRDMQLAAVEDKVANWVHWGDRPDQFSNWTNHSNRLIPIYSFGIGMESVKGENSVYRNEKKLVALYGALPTYSVNPDAEYFDQTDVYRLQIEAFAAGKKNIILLVFDGMDWQTSQAAAIYKSKKVGYTKGRGTGLSFLDYDKAKTDFGFFVTSPHNNDTKVDFDGQQVTQIGGEEKIGGYSSQFGGSDPWSKPGDLKYLIGKRKTEPHIYTDSAASATSMTTGIKTFNASINVAPDGSQAETIAHQMQQKGFAIGVVSSVPISHATPGCAYSHNVTRNDYQDITRDLLGLKSCSHPKTPLAGVDVLIGGGYGIKIDDDRKKQGKNFIPGNKYLSAKDLESIDVKNDGKYVVAQRTKNESGSELLMKAAKQAAKNGNRLFGFFGVQGGHLPFQTADGNYDPTRGIRAAEKYKENDITENPTLADMTDAALKVLEQNGNGFWLMIEAGDVDWANHNNNIDDSIGAVLSGDAAFDVVTKWVETNSTWDETAVIVTADHGHMLVLKDLEALTGKRKSGKRQSDKTKSAKKKAVSSDSKKSVQRNLPQQKN